MTSTHEGPQESNGSWEHIGRAAERFARRVARDAGRFAERMEEHAGEFAHDLSRDWRRLHREYERGCGDAARYVSRPDVRRVFEDIRSVVADVLEGVDELIERVFQDRPQASEAEWVRMVNNRDASCSQCARPLTAGDEAYARRTAEGMQLRCLDCGAPDPGTTQTS